MKRCIYDKLKDLTLCMQPPYKHRKSTYIDWICRIMRDKIENQGKQKALTIKATKRANDHIWRKAGSTGHLAISSTTNNILLISSITIHQQYVICVTH